MAEAPDPGNFHVRARAPRITLGGNKLAILSIAFWAAGFPAAEVLLATWDPLFLITARFAMALMMLIPLWALQDGLPVLAHANWLRAMRVGGLGFGVAAYLLLLAQWLTDPVTVAIVASATPIAATLIEIVKDGRRLTARFGLGLVAAVAGGIVASGGGLVANFGIGAVMCFVSGFLFSWGSRAAVKEFSDLSTLGRTTITFAGAFAFVLLALVASVPMGLVVLPEMTISSHQLLMLGIYGLVSLGISQFFYLAAVDRIGIALTSFHINTAPFYVMILMLALGADWNWSQAIGALIVCSGVFLAQERIRKVLTKV